ncbi:MAG TPA: FtsQ-type POTRA domain-containing protein [Verrucomicrobiae bacterium]|nr:FtsQ-type POTRA domain-containing protein [Verrucomicrobiae bacterium]
MPKTDSSKSRGGTLVSVDDNDFDDIDGAFLRPSSAPRSRSDRESAADRLTAKAVDSVGDTGPTARDDQPFLRTRRRPPVRQGFLPPWVRTRWGGILAVAAALVVAGGVVWTILAIRDFLNNDPHFRIDTAASIQTVGNSQLTRDDLLSVFGADIGRNVFFIPLTTRRAGLERIPWVEHATVMRILPNQLRVAVRERTPIAFVRVGDQVKLVDAAGVILDMPPAMIAARHFSFPVVTGIKPGDPLSVRTPRMHLYQRFIADMDSGGQKISSDLSEIDLSDIEDVRATLPAGATDMLLHFGDEKFLARYHTYQQHLAEWQQQYPHLASVDLRYDTQVVLKMADGHAADTEPAPAQPAATASAAPPKPASTAAAHKHSVQAARHTGAVR